MRIKDSLALQKMFKIYRKDSRKYRMLSYEQEHEIGLRILKGDESAIEELVVANLRFVIAKASKLFDEHISFLDLVAEGNKGLISAARKFDTTRGFRFVTFAAWDVHKYMQTAIRKARIVNVPVKKLRLKKEVLRAFDAFQFEHHRAPSDIELSEIVGLSPQMISECLQYNAHRTIGTLDGLEIADTSLNVEQSLVEQATVACIRTLVTNLRERERYIIEGFFGISMPERLTHHQMGAHLDLSSERVRQVKREALIRLKRKRRLLEN